MKNKFFSLLHPALLSKPALLFLLGFNSLCSLLCAISMGYLYPLLSTQTLPPLPKTTLLLCLFCLFLCQILVNLFHLFLPIQQLHQLIRNAESSDWKDIASSSRPKDNNSLALSFQKILTQQKALMEKEYQSEILRQQTELMAFQSQINPHFLYNTLDSIRGLALIHHMEEIAQMTEALSRLFRRMIAKEGKLIPLSDELDAVKSYMTIQQFRFDNRFDFQIDLEIPALKNCLVPNLIVQPIVENAVIHGLEKKKGFGLLQIRIFATTERLIIAVEDNGMGISGEKLHALNRLLSAPQSPSLSSSISGNGIALHNINQRIALQFGTEYGIRIMSTLQVNTVVEIVLPLIEETL